MTQSLIIPGAFRGDLLMDELLAVFPEWLVDTGGQRRCLLSVYTWPDRARLEFPESTPAAAVLAVVHAHDPVAETAGERLGRRVRQLAASAEGQPIEDLTPAQVRALLAVLLQRAGAVDEAGRVRPMAGWL